jgi:hypothetical protein
MGGASADSKHNIFLLSSGFALSLVLFKDVQQHGLQQSVVGLGVEVINVFVSGSTKAWVVDQPARRKEETRETRERNDEQKKKKFRKQKEKRDTLETIQLNHAHQLVVLSGSEQLDLIGHQTKEGNSAQMQ